MTEQLIGLTALSFNIAFTRRNFWPVLSENPDFSRRFVMSVAVVIIDKTSAHARHSSEECFLSMNNGTRIFQFIRVPLCDHWIFLDSVEHKASDYQ